MADEAPLTSTVGVDIDTHDGYVFTRTLLRARGYGEVVTDYTRKGFHLVISLPEPVSLARALDIRRMLGDDPVRLEYDEAKLRYGNYTGFDTLFKHKIVKGRKGRTVKRFESRI